MGRVVLIIGGVIGCIVVVLGVLFLILAVTQPDANQSDEIVGFGIFTGIGLVIAAPCLFFAYRMTPQGVQDALPAVVHVVPAGDRRRRRRPPRRDHGGAQGA
ncbi:MAG: hypothetical protein E6J40_12300 [Chloroflexi bacterium]|nr:MAG: hypothetical protein E6J40_12300 [Chloroflexota bacterium]